MAKKIANKEKKVAWDAFSRFIRVRDCLDTTGLAFVGRCITCNRKFHIRALQAGHCLPGRTNSKLFDERLVHAQCRYFNEYKHGEKTKYEAAMIKRYGQAEFEQMKTEARKIVPDNGMDFIALKTLYENKYRELMKSRGFKTYGELLQQNNI